MAVFKAFFSKKSKKLEFKPDFNINNESFLYNGVLYNYFELMNQHNITNDSKTDGEVFFRLLEEKGVQILASYNADYSFIYANKDEKLLIMRDFLGTHPVYYEDNDEFFKACDESSNTSLELKPGTLLELDMKEGIVKLYSRVFFNPVKDFFESFEDSVEVVAGELFRAISSRVYNIPKFVIFSDSGKSSNFITQVARDLNCDFKIVNPDNGKEKINELKMLFPSSDNNTLNHLLPFYHCCEKAKEDFYEVIISPFGFMMDYESLLDAYKTLDYYYTISKKFNVSVRYPFLDNKLLDMLLNLSSAERVKVFEEVYTNIEN
ncbi:Glutamine amidotransferase domain protein [Candidatus Tiddalikarchaeum anstoanum]|nr:Glutamine amidotransferase domain protein [Candidatus Tiddalikarchaeum anstoanum]